MSFWSGVKSFFEAIGKEIEAVFGSTTTSQKIQGAVTLIGAAVVTVTNLIAGPAASALVSGILKQIQADYATIATVVQQSTPTSTTTAITAVQLATASLKANLTALLTDAGVKSAASFTAIQNEATTILNEIEAIEAAFAPAATSPSTTAPAAS